MHSLTFFILNSHVCYIYDFRLTLSLWVTCICVNFSTVYNDMLAAKRLKEIGAVVLYHSLFLLFSGSFLLYIIHMPVNGTVENMVALVRWRSTVHYASMGGAN